MKEAQNLEELMYIQLKAIEIAEKNHPNDSVIEVIKSINLRMSAEFRSMRTLEGPKKKDEIAPQDLSDTIASTSIKIFKEKLLKPALGREILPYLRMANIPLPEDDWRATAAITAVYAKRRQTFKRVPGRSPKAASKWHLQS